MPEIVVNRCYGGFGLSDEGLNRYAELKGLTLYPEIGQFNLTTFWTVPLDKRPKILDNDKFYQASLEDRNASNKAHGDNTLTDRDIPRDDLSLVQVVKELGKVAWGGFAELEVVTIPSDVEWEIEEYDGTEWVAEKHRTW